MKTNVALAIMAVLFLQATGLDTAVAPSACTRTCPTDGPEGACAPMCPDCVCCPTLRSCVQPEPTALVPVTSPMPRVVDQEGLPRDARPAEIFHIPKSFAA